jgi:dipeptidyl aminopeptidase/acylaminoacyl peptidase
MESVSVPCGAWPSPLGAAAAAVGRARIHNLHVDGPRTYWIHEGVDEGRTVLFRHEPGRPPCSAIDLDVASRVYEYGGGSYVASGATVWAVSGDDGRIYRRDQGSEARRPITPPTDEPTRHGDLRLVAGFVTCVRERHRPHGVEHDVVAVPAGGDGIPTVLVGGNDFYSFPRPSPDGRLLAWLTWNHPQLPWTGCELWLGELALPDGVRNAVKIAGGPGESIWQPEWSPGGTLHFVSDRTGWWNVYRHADGEAVNVAPAEVELGWPQWELDLSTIAFLDERRIACIVTAHGAERLHVLDAELGTISDVGLPFTSYLDVRASGMRVAFQAASAFEPSLVASYDFARGALTVVDRTAPEPDRVYASEPRDLSFPTTRGGTAHMLFYPPRNGGFRPLPGERPPLIVTMHGGPTGNTVPELRPDVQFWTTRGFAVAEVNHRGSTGYGRAYRELLRGEWGSMDVDDCVEAARYLADRGFVDRERMAIRGVSAGGLIVLAALAFHDVLAAGVSICGIADLELLARHAHKFESRYLDWLLGPLPESIDLFRARSPLYAADRIDAPLLLFHGLRDAIVPASQSQAIADALRSRRVPCALVTFPDEGHGIVNPENARHALETELAFYAQIFGFEPADQVPALDLGAPRQRGAA